MKENENVKVLSYKGSVFAVEPPLFVELEITETEPGVKATLLLTYSSPLPLRPVLLLRFRSLSSRVSASRSTPVPVSIWAAARPSKNLQPTGMAVAIPDLDI